MNDKIKAGIIGCGNIGTELALFIDDNEFFELCFLSDIDKSSIENLCSKLNNNKPQAMTIKELIINSDLIIEAAGKDAVNEILRCEELDKSEKKLLIMSTGGIIGNLELFNKIKNCNIILPTGAICGLDAIKAASPEIEALSLTTTKNPKSLSGAPYITENNIVPESITEKKVIFEGSIEEAVRGFPKNINVAATLYLASKFEDIKIKIIADPNTNTNNHEILCTGSFGKIYTKAGNKKSKNPKTSYLAILSAMQALKNLCGNVRVGV